MKTKKQRPIDKNAEETFGWLGSSFVYVSNAQIKVWKVALIVIFVTGVFCALIFSVNFDIHSSSEASKLPVPLLKNQKAKQKNNQRNKKNLNTVPVENSATYTSPNQPDTPPQQLSPNPNPPAQQSNTKPLDRIGTRIKNNEAEFYDKQTGKTFVPRGNTYMDLLTLDGNVNFQNWGPKYDSKKAEDALGWMEHDGYNVVRIFPWSGNIQSPGVDPVWMNSIVDFLTRANKHKIHVVFGFGQFEAPLGYQNQYTSPPLNISGLNAIVLDQNRIDLAKTWMTDFLKYIKAADPNLMSTIMADEIWNEPYYNSAEKPFSLNSGTISICNGIYDLSSVSSRKQLTYDCAKFWINQVTKAVKEVDSGILVGTPVFTPYEIGKSGYDGVQSSGGDSREPFSLKAVYDSDVDYVDTHIYRKADNYDLAVDLNSAGLNSIGKNKPRMMSEFGANKAEGYFPANLSDYTVGQGMMAVQVASCALGYKGWIFYSWNTDAKPHANNYWYVIEKGQWINGMLAPIARPDPCSNKMVGQ